MPKTSNPQLFDLMDSNPCKLLNLIDELPDVIEPAHLGLGENEIAEEVE